MKFRKFHPPFDRQPVRILALIMGLGIMIGGFLRAFWLSYPHVRVFDEVYFPVFAKQYLDRVNVFDVHPPLGKFIIAVGIRVFGDSQIGWRIMPLLFGLGAIWLMGALWHSYTKDRLASFLVAYFVAIDGMFIAYSRTGLMDGILFFFIFACLLAMVRNRKESPMLLVATLVGLTMSIKWVGLAVVIPVGYLAYKKGKFNEFLLSLWWSLAVYLVVVGAGEWLDREPNVLRAIIAWHIQAAQYQATLTATHPYSSQWWTWPFMLRPVLFIYDGLADGSAQVMMTLGNPFVWLASTVAVAWSIIYLGWQKFGLKQKIGDHPLVLPLLGWGAAFFPWMFIHRVVFLYHYMPAYGFALLMLAYWLARWFRKEPWVVVGICALFLISTLYFAPLFVGWWPLSAAGLKQHIWLTRWLY